MSIIKVAINKVYTKCIPEDVRFSEERLKNSIAAGWNIGKRCSQINNKGLVKDMYTRGNSIVRNVRSHTTKEDLPAIGLVAGTVFPFPATFLIGYLLGRVALYSLKFCKNLRH